MTDGPYNPYSPAYLKKALASSGLHLSKKMGQNYLADRNYAEKIVDAVPEGSAVLEVGSGMGALTSLLCGRFHTCSLEIDRGVYGLLSSLLSSPNLTLIHADFLKYDLSGLLPGRRLFLVSNLPYSITGEALRLFIESPRFYAGIVMVQREFAERMSAAPGAAGYGVLSILSQHYLDTRKLFTVGRSSFFPVPSVDSVVLRLDKKAGSAARPQEGFSAFLRKGFLSRRKTVRNNLKEMGLVPDALDSALEALGIDGGVRPEDLSPAQWSALYGTFGKTEG